MAPRTRRLLVEGADDLHAVVNLMRHHMSWPEDKPSWPVLVENAEGAANILDAPRITATVKESGLEVLGIILDADADFSSRWQSIRDVCRGPFPNMPQTLPREGLIVDEGAKRLGVWIMPDNQSAGSLELFLKALIPQPAPLWQHADQAVTGARDLNAPFEDKDRGKAQLHTWLAWQKSPGRPFGVAITQRILDPGASAAQPFVNWFRRLYRIAA